MNYVTHNQEVLAYDDVFRASGIFADSAAELKMRRECSTAKSIAGEAIPFDNMIDFYKEKILGLMWTTLQLKFSNPLDICSLPMKVAQKSGKKIGYFKLLFSDDENYGIDGIGIDLFMLISL